MKIRRTTIQHDSALSWMIKEYGVRQFARDIGMDHANLNKIVNDRLVISDATYKKLKKAFLAIQNKKEKEDGNTTTSDGQSKAAVRGHTDEVGTERGD